MRMSPIHKKALDRIEDERQYIHKIKTVRGKVDGYNLPFRDNEGIYLAPEEADIILKALDSDAEARRKECNRILEALKCGSEDGDIRSHSEKKILKGCIGLMESVAAYAHEYLEYLGIEVDREESEDFCCRMSYGEIVSRLFLNGTTHSGGTSTMAKCRELGVDYSEYAEITFYEDEEDEEE